MTEITGEGQEPNESRTGRTKKFLRGVSKRTYAVLGVVAGLVTIAWAVWQFWPWRAPVIAFTNPVPGTVAEEPCSFTVTGRGAPPSGQALVIGNQQQGTGNNVDSTQNFAVIKTGPDTWQVNVQIGNSGTPGGTTYALTAWLADADWITYLTQVTPNQQPWWGTAGPPPGASAIQTVDVARTGGKCP
jgi:hypothetical protein